MRSRHVDRFNHDEDAPLYDADVLDETNPIRTGYRETLDWVLAASRPSTESAILELGSGTGNLSLRFPPVRRLVCVDVSGEMTALARAKPAASTSIEWVTSDLLEYFDREVPAFDAVVSTYAVHHLEEPEKRLLFDRVRAVLAPGGRAVFGDLMFENDAARKDQLMICRESGLDELADDIEDEYFWNVESAVAHLQGLGFTVSTKRFSTLSWGVLAEL